MKIAVLFKGSSISSYEHWQFKDKVSVHYKNTINNIKQNLLEKYDCDVFMHSWVQNAFDASEYEKLVDDYKPKSYILDNDIDGTFGTPLGKKVLMSTKKVFDIFENYRKENNIIYDLVIVLRFDIYFLQDFDLRNILDIKDLNNKVFVYALGPHLQQQSIDKNSVKDQGIDDNFIIFTPDTVAKYRECLAQKDKTTAYATSRSNEFFLPTQHCSLHHIYYLLSDDIEKT